MCDELSEVTPNLNRLDLDDQMFGYESSYRVAFELCLDKSRISPIELK